MEMRIESAEEFVEEFLMYRFLCQQRHSKNLKHLIKPKRSGPKPKCTAGPEELRRMYLDERKTAKEIAEMYGMAAGSIRKLLARHGIRREKKGT